MSLVKFTLELAGDISSFTLSVQAQIQGVIAALACVDPSVVELTVSPGSVIVDVSIQTYAVTAALVQSTMVSAVSNPLSATAMFASVTGISIAVLAVVTPPIVADVPPPPPPSPSPPPPMSPMSTGASAVETRLSNGASALETSGSTGIIIGVIAGVIIVLALALIFMRRRNKVEPDHEPDAHRAQRARVSASGLDDDERLRASGNRGAQRARVSASGLDDDERLRENRIRGPGEIPQDVSVVSMLIDQRGSVVETDGRNMRLETCEELD
jgi:hypothetical protein